MQPPRVLVADSDKLLLASYREYLTAEGFAVTTAHTGLKCLACLQDFAPDIFIVQAELAWDWEAGIAVLKARGADLAHLPLIVLCGQRDPNACCRLAIDFPLSERYVKPVRPMVLAQRIHFLISLARPECLAAAGM
jgi:DNA-binding response OmpR family regulator